MSERGNKKLRFIDYWFGIPILFLFGIFVRKNKPNPLLNSKLKNKNVNFLFVKTGAMGDTILLSAIAKEIKLALPNSKITLLCTQANSEIAKILDGIDNQYVVDFSNFIKTFSALLIKLKQKKENFDILIDFAAWPRIDAFISFFIPAKYKIGFKRNNQFRHFIYNHWVDHKDTIHEIQNYRRLLHAIGLETNGIVPSLKLSEIQNKYLDNSKNKVNTRIRTLLTNYKNIVVFHPFPSGIKKEFKMWPENNWIELALKYISLNYTVFITGSNQDSKVAKKITKIVLSKVSKKGVNKILSLAGELTIIETTLILSKACFLVSVNTGIMHLAAALGINVIALNGPTSINRWGAISKNEKNIINFTSNFECSPCLSLGFEYQCKAGGCMNRILLEDVAKVVF